MTITPRWAVDASTRTVVKLSMELRNRRLWDRVCKPRRKQKEVAGTPGYEVPEHDVSFAADVFSFFVTLWACGSTSAPGSFLAGQRN
jgi:hypothetical protein